MSSERVPVIRVGRNLLVSVQLDLHDRSALQLQDDLAMEIDKTPTDGVIIDVSSLDVVDSFIARVLGNIAIVARLLGTRTIISGIRPAVAMTLVQLGITLDGVETALDFDSAIQKLGLRSWDVETDAPPAADTE